MTSRKSQCCRRLAAEMWQRWKAGGTSSSSAGGPLQTARCNPIQKHMPTNKTKHGGDNGSDSGDNDGDNGGDSDDGDDGGGDSDDGDDDGGDSDDDNGGDY